MQYCVFRITSFSLDTTFITMHTLPHFSINRVPPHTPTNHLLTLCCHVCMYPAITCFPMIGSIPVLNWRPTTQRGHAFFPEAMPEVASKWPYGSKEVGPKRRSVVVIVVVVPHTVQADGSILFRAAPLARTKTGLYIVRCEFLARHALRQCQVPKSGQVHEEHQSSLRRIVHSLLP